MRLLLSLALLLVASGARGQGPAASAERAGGPQSDTGAAVAADEFGNVVMVGTLDGTGTFGSLSITADETGCVFSTCHDAYVVRYGADGSALWVRRMGTPVHNDFATDVAIHASTGDILVAGYFTGIATWDGGANPDIELTTRSDFDAFLARYTASGDLLWVVQGGGSAQDTGRSVALDFQGNAYWGGGFAGTATFGDGDSAVSLTSDGSTDGFVARVSPDGEIEWIKTVGGIENGIVYALSTGPFAVADFLAITGTFSGVSLVGDVPLQSRGLDDAFVARLNVSDGEVEWASQAGGNQGDQGRAVTISPSSGQVIVAGWFSGQIVVGSDVLTSAGLTDVLVAAFSNDGDALWGHRGGGASFDIATDVYASPTYDIVTRGFERSAPLILVSGYVDGPSSFSDASGGTVPVAPQEQDGFLAAYSDLSEPSRPELIAVPLLGGPNNDSGRGVTLTPSFGFPPPNSEDGGNLYLVTTGTFSGTATFFGETVQSAGSNDIFLAKQASCPDFYCFVDTASDETPEASGVRLSVAPHPATFASTLSVELDAPLELHVDLFDARGRRLAVLAEGPQSAGEHTIALPPLAPGIYLLRASTPEAVMSRPVTVVR